MCNIEIDALHKTISDLKIRIAKLEEYKRLQDDTNTHNAKHNVSLCDAMHDLEKDIHDHYAKQVDENRAVFKHLTQLDEDNAELNTTINDHELQLQLIPKNLENTMEVNIEILHAKIEQLDSWREALGNDLGSAHEKIMKLEDYIKLMNGDPECPAIMGTRPFVSTPKTTGLTFGEAIVALKSGYAIKRPGGYSMVINKKSCHCYSISIADIEATDWEIID